MKGKQKRLVTYTVGMGTVIFIVLCWVHYAQLATSPFKTLFGAASKTVSISGIFAVCYERYLWKFNPFESLPRLAKNYTGELTSTFDKKSRTLKIEIKQTLMSIRVRFNTDESQSDALSAEIIELNDELFLVYTYLNVPKAQFISESPIHYGTAILNIRKNRDLEGNYFTGRKTTGNLKVKAAACEHD